MDKKTIGLIVILAVFLLFYFQIMEFLGLYHPTLPKSVSEKQAVVDTTASTKVNTTSTPAINKDTLTIATKTLKSIVNIPVDSVKSDTIVVKTNRYRILLTSYGGGPISIVLKDYYYRDGKPIEMLPHASFATPEATFSGGAFSTSRIKFVSSLPPGEYDATTKELDLVYTYQSPNGGEIIKRFHFYPDKYNYDLSFNVNKVQQLGFERQYNLVWNTPLGVTEPQPELDYRSMQAVAMQSGSREKLDDFNKNKLNQSLDGNTAWGGLRSKYFAAVMIPKNREASSVFANGEKTKIPTADNKTIEKRTITVGLSMPFAGVSHFTDSFTVFVGPLDYTLMSKYKVGLEDILGIGTTPYVGWIIKPFAIAIIWFLPKMYKVIPNYGFVIILFAFLVKIITLPLSMKSFKSMNAMKTLQPKIDELKKKYKKNPQALNSEMMKLYKAHGVNPISGCLPMLPQMPLFFALFSVFRSTILLRDAPFIWFITDLSRGATSFMDPYIILVVIMIIAQFVSQKLTMSTGQQNKALMYVMPVFMGFIFYKFSAGLVLYWACFSIFSLMDYFLFKRKNVQVQTT